MNFRPYGILYWANILLLGCWIIDNIFGVDGEGDIDIDWFSCFFFEAPIILMNHNENNIKLIKHFMKHIVISS